MTEREIDYDKSRVEYEFFDKSTETFSVRLIALPNTEILTCAKKDITTIDKEDSGIIEVFLKDRKFRMGYAGTLPGTRDADIILLDAWCGTGTGGGGGGGDATAANQTLEIGLLTQIRDQQTDGTQDTSVNNLPTDYATEPTLSNIYVRLNDGTTHVVVDSGSVSVSNQITGYATSALQTTGNTTLSNIYTRLGDGSQHTIIDSGTVNVGNFPATQPISAVSLPLPSGAATSANQTSQITQETAINTVLGTQSDAAAGTDIANASQISLFKRLLQRVTTLITDSATALTNWASLLNRIPAALTAGGNFKVSIEEGNLSTTGGIDKVKGTPTHHIFTAANGTGGIDALNANANRNYLCIVNDGAHKIYLGYGVNATSGQGEPLLPGASKTFDCNYIPTCAIRVVSTSGTSSIRFVQG